MIETRVTNFCIKAKAFRGDKKLVRWSKELKQEALTLLDAGVSMAALAQGAGISEATIQYWLESRTSKSKPRFSEVKIKPTPMAPATSTIEIISVTPKQRIEIKGLTVENLKTLLREGLL